jgi:subfamily B ATP-binding cassette protein MsbA
MKTKSEFGQLWGLLSKYMRPYWPQMLLSLICYFIASLLTAAQPVVTAPVLEVALKGPEAFNQLGQDIPESIWSVDLNNIGQYLLHLFFPAEVGAWNVILAVALIYFVVSVSLYVLNFLVYLLGIWIRFKAGRDMQAGLFLHVMNLSLDFFNKRRTGELISRLDKDTDAVVFGIEAIVRALIVSSVLVVIYGALLIRTSLRLSLFVVIAAGLQYLFVQMIKKPSQRRVREQFNVVAEVTAYLQEVISNVRLVKSFVAEDYEGKRLRSLSKRAAEAGMRFGFYKNIDEPVTFIINSAMNVAILLFAANELIAGQLSTTGFFLYLYVGRSILDPLTNLARTLKTIQTTAATSERVQELFGEISTIKSGNARKQDITDKIVFQNVHFNYGQSDVLEDVNLEIERGQMVALVGQSGAGKSTITDLVLRFYDPQKGKITLDGLDLRSLDLAEYRRMIGVVSQDSILFNASVSENIAYPDPVPDLGRVGEAARVANASEFIQNLSRGYETLVGDRGVLLSGGQKQRITIARAVYHKPKILVLDEATSALDTESERLVQEALDKIVEGTTAIVIAHRLSTIVHADKIVVMERGRILDQGSHQELLSRSSVYRRLCELQFGASALPPVERPA